MTAVTVSWLSGGLWVAAVTRLRAQPAQAGAPPMQQFLRDRYQLFTVGPQLTE
jgi:hypothetical protein